MCYAFYDRTPFHPHKFSTTISYAIDIVDCDRMTEEEKKKSNEK